METLFFILLSGRNITRYVEARDLTFSMSLADKIIVENVVFFV